MASTEPRNVDIRWCFGMAVHCNHCGPAVDMGNGGLGWVPCERCREEMEAGYTANADLDRRIVAEHDAGGMNLEGTD